MDNSAFRLFKEIIVGIPITFSTGGYLFGAFVGAAVATASTLAESFKQGVGDWLNGVTSGEVPRRWQDKFKGAFVQIFGRRTLSIRNVLWAIIFAGLLCAGASALSAWSVDKHLVEMPVFWREFGKLYWLYIVPALGWLVLLRLGFNLAAKSSSLILGVVCLTVCSGLAYLVSLFLYMISMAVRVKEYSQADFSHEAVIGMLVLGFFALGVWVTVSIYLMASVVLKAICHLSWVPKILNIQTRPVESVGVIAGLVVAVPCWVIATLRWFLQ